MRRLGLALLLVAACRAPRADEAAADDRDLAELSARMAQLEKWLEEGTDLDLAVTAGPAPRATRPPEVVWFEPPYVADQVEPTMRETGKVLQVDPGPFGVIVAISAGENAGVKAGDVCHLRRGGSYVGQLRIDRVTAHQSVGRFDTVLFGRAAPPVAGDVAFAR